MKASATIGTALVMDADVTIEGDIPTICGIAATIGKVMTGLGFTS
jgi:hypothetical protein